MHSTSFRLSRITYVFLGIIAGVFMGTTIRFVYASWSAPTATPPDGNVDAPINVSADTQNKTGNIGIGSSVPPILPLEVTGGALISGTLTLGERIKIGDITNDTCDPTIEGTQRYNKTNKTMEYCDGVEWKGMSVITTNTTNTLRSFTGTGCAACPYEVHIQRSHSSNVSFCKIKNYDGSLSYNGDVLGGGTMCNFSIGGDTTFTFWSY